MMGYAEYLSTEIKSTSVCGILRVASSTDIVSEITSDEPFSLFIPNTLLKKTLCISASINRIFLSESDITKTRFVATKFLPLLDLAR